MKPSPVTLRCAWLLVLLAVAAQHAQAAVPSPSRVLTFDQAQAALADWQSQTPPVSGWTPVTLPDDWSNRWPAHDGVVWYRLR